MIKRIVSSMMIFALIFSMLPLTINAEDAAKATHEYFTEDERFQLTATGRADLVPAEAELTALIPHQYDVTRESMDERLRAVYGKNFDYELYEFSLTSNGLDYLSYQGVERTLTVLADADKQLAFYQLYGYTFLKSEVIKTPSDDPTKVYYTFPFEGVASLAIVDEAIAKSEEVQNGKVSRNYYGSTEGINFGLNVFGEVAKLPLPSEASLVVERASTDNNATVADLLSKRLDGEIMVEQFTLDLVANDQSFAIDPTVQTTVNVDWYSFFEKPYIYQYVNGKLTEMDLITTAVDDLTVNYSFMTNGLGDIVIVYSEFATKKALMQTYKRSYSDASNTLTFDLEMTTDEELNLPETATVQLNDATNGDSIDAKLKAKYVGDVNYEAYHIQLVAEDGSVIAIPQNAKVTITYNATAEDVDIYSFVNGGLKKVKATKADNAYTFDFSNLQSLILVDATNLQVNRLSDFAEGTYSITANVYVKGENNVVLSGVTAYLTNPSIPPVTPVEHTAIMHVDEDGYFTLELDLQNTVFSLQHVESGTDVFIDSWVFGTNEELMPTSEYGAYKGRIQKLIVTVDNLNGEYAFKNAKQYPTILKETKLMDIHLGVDYASAVRLLNSDGESFKFIDEQAGSEVTVQSIDSQTVEALKAATNKTDVVTEDEVLQVVANKLQDIYVDSPIYQLYDVNLFNKANEKLSFSWSEALAISLPTNEATKADLFHFDGEKLTKVQSKVENGRVVAENIERLGYFVVVDPSTIASWLHKAVIDANTGIVVNIYGIDGYTSTFRTDTLELVGAITNKSNEAQTLKGDRAQLLAEVADFGNPAVTNIYSFGITHAVTASNLDRADYRDKKVGASWPFWIGPDNSFITLNIPTSNVDSKFYVVTKDGQHTTMLPLSSTYKDGVAKVEAISRTATKDEGSAQVINYYWGARNVEPTTQRPISYIIEVTEQKIEKPVAKTGLVESTTEQVGVVEGEGYTLQGHTAKTAGKYEAVATLKEGYVWADGTTEDLTIAWEISKQTSSNQGSASTKTVTANLYVPGEKNTQLPGVNAYLTNGNNPLGIGGYDKVAPTTPASNNATLKTDANGQMTLTFNVLNPVFTLQKLAGSTNAKVIDVQTTAGDFGKYSSRISKVTVELLDNSGTYIFNDAVEYPTLLNTEWYVPLTLQVEFNGGTSSLPSQTVEVGNIGGGAVTTPGEEIKTTLENGTVVVEVLQQNGDKSVSFETVNGSTTKALVKPSGKVVASIALSAKELEKAGTAPITLALPEVNVVKNIDEATELTFTAIGSDNKQAVNVIVLAKNVTPATVVVRVNEDGSTAVVSATKYNNGQLLFEAQQNVTYKVIDNSKVYKDVATNAWFNDYMQYTSARQWIVGSNGEFKPNDYLTRVQFALILHRMNGEVEPTATNQFKDVALNEYYTKAITWAYEKGFIKGFNDGTFGIHKTITREQLLVIFWRSIGSPEAATPTAYKDFNVVSPSAQQAVAWALEQNIISGKEDGIIDPMGNVTRAQATKIFMNFMEKYGR